ncbi:MAG: hypothetical protein AB8B57_12295 [Congregibacter sp.]
MYQFVIAKALAFWSLVIFVLTASYLSDSLVMSITLLYVLGITIILRYGSNGLQDPRLLFVGFYLLYSSFYQIGGYIGLDLVFPFSCHSALQAVHLATIGLVAYLVGTSIACYGYKPLSIEVASQQYFCNSKVTAFYGSIFSIGTLLILCLLLLILSKGFQSKREIVDLLSTPNQLALHLFTLLIAVCAIRLVAQTRPQFFSLYNVILIAVCLAYLLVAGERDPLFRFLLIYVVIRSQTNSAKRFAFILTLVLVFAAAFIVPSSQIFKSVMLSGINMNKDSLMALLFSNEFIGPGRNLTAVVYFDAESDISLIFSDMARGLIPSFIFDGQSAGSWYNNEFRVENGISGRSGWGFGLVPEGFVVGGTVGVVFLLSLLGLLMGIFYRFSQRSVMTNAAYTMLLVSSIYVIRSDLASFVSMTFKILPLIFLSVFVLEKIFGFLVSGRSSGREHPKPLS